MENSLYIALSHQTALFRKLETVANNMANVNTAGYKETSQLFTQYLDDSQSMDRPPADKIAYVQDYATVRNFAVGSLQATGNPLDVAIKGDGFFSVDTPEGERFTRNGHFKLNAEGILVTNEGYPVLSSAGTPFFFAETEREITISKDGSVSTENGVVGQLKVVNFDNLQKLKETYGGLYETSGDNLPFEITPRVEQGMLEGSNVNPVLEMTNMIKVQRAYEAAQNLINSEDTRISSAINALSAKSSM